ncbi:MAG: T9SS type A sorting domain-containing protein [Bacteroidota bacterium]
MNVFFRALIVLLLFNCGLKETKANHMIGAEIFYTWKGGKKYEVTARIYRDCQGIPLTSPSMRVSDYNGIFLQISYTRISIEDVTEICKSATKPCSPSNSSITGLGVELHTFVGTVDFAQAPFDSLVSNSNTCKLYFSMEQCCRTSTTTFSGGNYYVDAMVDICNSGYRNSSPQLKTISSTMPHCNIPMYQNYGGNDFIDYDSLGFELDSAVDDYNSYFSYNGNFSNKIPMTPYCLPATTIACKPTPTAKPPRGFYFDSTTGNIIYTPSNCSEVGAICVKISEYRRDPNNKKKMLLVGFVRRDMTQFVKNISAVNSPPTTSTLSTYKFVTREKSCMTFNTYDARVFNASFDDTTFISVDLPPGATFSYVDSSAREKVGKLCWTVPDSVYLKTQSTTKTVPIFLSITDNHCNWAAMVKKAFYIQILPPDSSGLVKISSFDDKNGNNLKDLKDSSLPVTFRLKDKTSFYYSETDKNGQFSELLGIGNINLSVAKHPYYEIQNNDTTLLIKMDSIHHINFGIYRNPGIYGRIYEDQNSNCKYDLGEKLYSGHKVFTDSNKYVGISDKYGVYYIQAPAGSYKLNSDLKPKQYQINCPNNNSIPLTINSDSVYLNNDFGIAKDTLFEDVSLGINIGRLRRGGTGSVTFHCYNNGYSTRKNIKIMCPLYGSKFSINDGVKNYLPNTLAIIPLDSILPGEKRTIICKFNVHKDSFIAGNKICFSAYFDTTTTQADIVQNNNSSYICRTVDAPHDPNEKTVVPDTFVSILDNTINYDIHFQNTGTDTAIRVVVKDTIDTRYLDLEKFNLNWSDFPCESIISGNIITFIFDDIYLPHLSAAGDKSIAGFNFTLGLKANVKNEKSFDNSAAIFFDYENPIITKKESVNIVSPLSIIKIINKQSCLNESNRIYYNSHINLENNNTTILEISDINGSFANPVILNSKQTSSTNDSITFNVPANFTVAGYTLRLRTTHPATTSIPGSGYMQFSTTAKPSYQVNSNLKNNSICEADTLKINLSNNALLYSVFKNNVPYSNFNANQSYSFKIALKDSFKFIALDNVTGCKDTTLLRPIIHKKASITASIMNRKADYCEGESLLLKGTGGTYYSFIKNNSIIGTKSLNDTLTNKVDVDAIYKITGEDNNGCIATSDTLMIVALPLPVATIAIIPNVLCEKDTIVITMGTGVKYDLFKNNINLLKGISNNQYKTNVTSNGDQFYTIAYTNKGCSTVSQNSSIQVNPLPSKPVISASGDNLNVSASSGTIAWYRNNLLLSITGNILNNAPSGVYRVMITSNDGCSSTSDNYTHVNVSVKKIEATAITVYPNPANSLLNINYQSTGYHLTLFNSNGQAVITTTDNNGLTSLQTAHLSEGLYLLYITAANGESAVIKVSIVR